MKYRKISLILLVYSISLFYSCRKFVEVGAPKNSLVPSNVFKNDALATSTVLGMYQQMALSGPYSGDQSSIATLCGLTADEYIGYGSLQSYYQNHLLPVDGSSILWSQLYKRIYDANAILEGLNEESTITPSVKSQLRGEALFVRAFSYFYLVNLYGSVPLNLTTDYQLNSKSGRSSVSVVYQQILDDLKSAEPLLSENYITVERVRPNKSTVQALLAKTYLYLNDWVNAEKYAGLVIGKSSIYNLIGLDEIFLKNSQEAIWQLMPAANTNTPAGSFLILSAAPTFVSLRPDLVQNAFETNDLRKSSWIKSLVSSGVTYYYPFKYKVRSSTAVSEYIMVFRLAEQFLIRAEARAQQNKLSDAIDDLDVIRKRAGLQTIKNTNPGISQLNLLTIIQKERLSELFSEGGNRWFDLKRTGQSNVVLGATKSNWKPTAVLFPIPSAEINLNLNISQNEGY